MQVNNPRSSRVWLALSERRQLSGNGRFHRALHFSTKSANGANFGRSASRSQAPGRAHHSRILGCLRKRAATRAFVPARKCDDKHADQRFAAEGSGNPTVAARYLDASACFLTHLASPFRVCVFRSQPSGSSPSRRCPDHGTSCQSGTRPCSHTVCPCPGPRNGASGRRVGRR